MLLRLLGQNRPSTTKRGFYSLLVLSGFGLQAPSAFAAECLEIQTAGDTCKELKIKADLSKCHDDLSGPPEIRCKRKGAEVLVHGKNSEYEVRLTTSGSAWGKGWVVSSVRTTKVPTTTNQESPQAAAPKEPERSIARVALPGTVPAPMPPAPPPPPAVQSQAAPSSPQPVLAKAPDVSPAPPSASASALPPKSEAAVQAVPAAPAETKAVVESSASPSTPPAQAQTQTPPVNGFQFSAYFDAYYAHNFNTPQAVTPLNSGSAQGAMIPSPQNNLHFYNWYSNQLGLNLAEFTIKHVRKETTFVLDLDFGQMADINAQVPVMTASGGPLSSTVDEVSKHIGQAVFSYMPEGISGLTLELGKMPTHVGLELIKAKDNWNYTRGVMFSEGGPFWHTGFHAGYAVVPSRFIANIYLYQGWNTIYENNSSPTYGAELKWTPSDSVALVYNYIGGPEQARNNSNWKQVHEANLVYSPISTLSLAADFLAGSEKGVTFTNGNTGDAQWTGLSLLGKWQVHPRYSLAPRFEVYRDSQGYTLGGDGQTIWTYTLTQAFQICEGFESRLEFRLDQSSSADRFVTGSGTSPNQSVALLGFLYSM